MLTKQQKIEQGAALAEELKTQESWYFVGFSGITFPQLNELRKLLREKGAKIRIIKTRVLGKALESIGKTIPAETEGQPVAILTMEDYLATAKILTAFVKDHPNLTIYGGYVEGENVDSAKIAIFASLPSADELKAKLVGTLNAPIYRFVTALAWPGRGITSVLKQRLAQLT